MRPLCAFLTSRPLLFRDRNEYSDQGLSRLPPSCPPPHFGLDRHPLRPPQTFFLFLHSFSRSLFVHFNWFAVAGMLLLFCRRQPIPFDVNDGECEKYHQALSFIFCLEISSLGLLPPSDSFFFSTRKAQSPFLTKRPVGIQKPFTDLDRGKSVSWFFPHIVLAQL